MYSMNYVCTSVLTPALPTSDMLPPAIALEATWLFNLDYASQNSASTDSHAIFIASSQLNGSQANIPLRASIAVSRSRGRNLSTHCAFAVPSGFDPKRCYMECLIKRCHASADFSSVTVPKIQRLSDSIGRTSSTQTEEEDVHVGSTRSRNEMPSGGD